MAASCNCFTAHCFLQFPMLQKYISMYILYILNVGKWIFFFLLDHFCNKTVLEMIIFFWQIILRTSRIYLWSEAKFSANRIRNS